MHRKLAYLKGAEMAKKTFGAMLDAVPKPPPVWAHGRNVTLPSLVQADRTPKRLKG